MIVLRALAVAGIWLSAPFAMAAAGVVGFATGPFATPLYILYDDSKRLKMADQGKDDMRPELPLWLALPLASNVFATGMVSRLVWGKMDSWLESHVSSMV